MRKRQKLAVAAAVFTTAALAGGYTAFAQEAEQQQTLTVQILDRSGGVPDGSRVFFSDNAAPQDTTELEFDADGVATASLEPGDYTMAHSTWTDAAGGDGGEMAIGLTGFTIGSESAEIVLDAAVADAVSVEVEQPDAELLATSISLTAYTESGDQLQVAENAGPDTEVYLFPASDLPGYETNFFYAPTLVSPAGASDPYQYNLAFPELGGYPADTAYAVSDSDLAEVQTSYPGLGAAVDGRFCIAADPWVQVAYPECVYVDTPAPGERTNYFTVDTDVKWRYQYEAGTWDDNGIQEDGFFVRDYFEVEAGASTWSVPRGPLAPSLGSYGVTSTDDDRTMSYNPSPFQGPDGESIRYSGWDGESTAELFVDGESLEIDDTGPSWDGSASFDLSDASAGRYTLAFEGTHGAENMALGTEVSNEWSFDLDPSEADEEGYLSAFLPTVAIVIDGAAGGFVPRESDEATLDLMYGDDAGLQDLVFEVSYDDGATWTETELDFEPGSTSATAALDHPADAEYVSIRVTGTNGPVDFEHTVLRSFGLR